MILTTSIIVQVVPLSFLKCVGTQVRSLNIVPFGLFLVFIVKQRKCDFWSFGVYTKAFSLNFFFFFLIVCLDRDGGRGDDWCIGKWNIIKKKFGAIAWKEAGVN